MPPDFFDFLATSVDLLERDTPEIHSTLAQSLAGITARLSVGRRVRLIRFAGDRFEISYDASTANVEIKFSEQAIFDLIDGAVSLEDAIVDETLWMRGNVEVIEQFYDALLVYLEGALRCAAFPALLERYRRGCWSSAKRERAA